MAKGMMIIDGQRVSFDGEKNVLSVIRKAGIEMPTFCYYSDLSVYGACRMCVVENEETGKIYGILLDGTGATVCASAQTARVF